MCHRVKALFKAIVFIFLLVTGDSQTLIGPSSVAVEQGEEATLPCRVDGGTGPYTFNWLDTSANPVLTIFSGDMKTDDERYGNFEVSNQDTSSTVIISQVAIDDEGSYICSIGVFAPTPAAEIDVEVKANRTMDTFPCIAAGESCTVECKADGGRPEEIIEWYIDSIQQISGVDTTNPASSNPDLFNTRSVLTYRASQDDEGQVVECRFGGHSVARLNGSETKSFKSTTDGDIAAEFDSPRISCEVAKQSIPVITNFFIYVDGNLIYSDDSSDGVVKLSVQVVLPSLPQNKSNFTCVAGNYLGNATSTYEFVPTNTPSPLPSVGSTESSCTSEGLSSGVVAGISILALFLSLSLALNVVLFVLWRREKLDPKKANNSGHVASAQGDNKAYEMIESGRGSGTPNTTYTALKTMNKADTPIPACDVTFFTRLGSFGSGDFGDVWKGELRSPQGPTAIAVRQIRGNASTSIRLATETLSRLKDHSNVVKCVGYCDEQQSIVYEFVSGGTLLTHLQSGSTYSNIKANRSHVDEASLAKFAWQIAKGMEFLTSEKIVNGTLCAHNVLMTASKLCKISDYGLLSLSSALKIKPTRWSSIEMLQNGVCAVEGDVWSFGIVVWEIVTLGAKPYPNMNFTKVKQEVYNGYKMPRPRHCGEQLYQMMIKCWNNDPKMRPNFSRLLQELEKLMEQTHDYISLDQLDPELYASVESVP